MNKNFIKTQDEKTAEELRKYLNELPKQGQFYVFVNDPTVKHFEKTDKMIHSDKMLF